jgi:HlyD family secretion protein
LDIKRDPPKKTKKYIAFGAAAVGLIVITGAISRLKPAAPTVERGTLWFGVVTRGPWKREVNAPGTLVPEHIRYIAATTSGRVESLPVRPGVQVSPTTMLVEMSNPDEQIRMLQYQQSVDAGVASLAALRTQLHQSRLSQESVIANLRTQLQKAIRDAAVQDSLATKKLAIVNDVTAAHEVANDLKTRLDIELQRLDAMKQSETQQIQLQEAQVEGLRRILQNQRERVASMRVMAPEVGQLQMLGNPQLELGQWVNAGTEVARVVQPGKLKAVLRVPETQAKDVAVGQQARIDLHNNNEVKGHVIRKDPSSQNGTITVEVALDGALPPGTSSDLAVDGSIEIERVADAIFVGRPGFGQPDSKVGIFKVNPGQGEANRITVDFGPASVNTIIVKSNLNVGDSVIISDMSAYDNTNRVRIK